MRYKGVAILSMDESVTIQLITMWFKLHVKMEAKLRCHGWENVDKK